MSAENLRRMRVADHRFPGAVKTFTLSVLDATGAVTFAVSFGPIAPPILHSFRRQSE